MKFHELLFFKDSAQITVTLFQLLSMKPLFDLNHLICPKLKPIEYPIRPSDPRVIKLEIL